MTSPTDTTEPDQSATAVEPDQENRTVVYLGNREAVEGRTVVNDDGTETINRQPLPGKRCTTVILAAGASLMEAASDLTHPQGVWASHSNAPAPAWVASTDPALAGLLAQHWGCELRDPEPDHVPSGDADTADDAADEPTEG